MILPETDKWNRPDRYYDQALLAYIGLVFDPEKASVDVGANVGYIARFLALRSRETVFAIEPGSSNLDCLRRNVDGLSNVMIVPCAAAQVGGGTVPFINGGTVTDHVAVSDRSKKIEQIKTVTVDDVVGDRAIGFVKIDVEGYEIDVLRGSRRTFERDQPVCVIEVVDGWLGRFGYGRDDVLSYFRSLGYQPPVDRFGRQSDVATDLVFAPDSVHLPRLYLSYDRENKRRAG